MTLLHPALLWGLLALGAPVLIHLLSRRQARRLQWAAMCYLVQASEKSRRRLRLQHLLLLLLRCLAVLFLVLAITRPRLNAGSGLLLSTPVEHIVLLDDSTSMQAVGGGASTWDRARDLLRDYVSGLIDHRPADRVTVRLTSNPEQPLIEALPATHQVLDPFLAVLQRLEPSHRPAEILKAATVLGRDAESDFRRELIVLTDLTQNDWGTPDANDEDPIADKLRELSQRFDQIHLVDCGLPNAENLSVTELEVPDASVTTGSTVYLRVTVANLGTVPSKASTVTLSVGSTAGRQQTVPALMPGRSATSVFQVVFSEPGLQLLTASVPADALIADNERHAGIHAVEALRVLLVDGAPGIGGKPGETFFLRRALAPPTRTRKDLEVRTIRHDELSATDLLDTDLVCLSNVPSLASDAAQALGSWVRNGGGLLITLGDRTTPAAYRELANEAPGMFPWQLQRAANKQVSTGIHLADAQHPALRIFAGKRNPFLGYLRIHRWWPLAHGNEEKTRCLARLGAAKGDPLLLETTNGQGRVALLTTAIDQDWSNWAANPSYVVMCQQLARHLAKRRYRSRVFSVGEVIRQPVAPLGLNSPADMFRPQGGAPHRLQAEVETERNSLSFVYPHTESPGLYRLVTTDANNDAAEIAFAVQLLSSEGALQSCSDAERRKLADTTDVKLHLGTMPDGGWGGPGRADLARACLIALLITVLAEQICAWFFGRRQSIRLGVKA